MDNILEWYLKPFKQYVDFEGRARRKEYWTFTLGNMLISLLLGGGGAMGFGSELIGGLFSLIVFIPGIAVAVRRLHDTGRSGFWIFILLVPLVGLFVMIYFLVLDSESGSNEYGPNPKTVTAL